MSGPKLASDPSSGVVRLAVIGLVIIAVMAAAGITTLAFTDHQTEASLTALATLGGSAGGALAALLTATASAVPAMFGGRRASDPPKPPEVSA